MAPILPPDYGWLLGGDPAIIDQAVALVVVLLATALGALVCGAARWLAQPPHQVAGIKRAVYCPRDGRAATVRLFSILTKVSLGFLIAPL